MDNMLNENASNKWLSVPLIATVTRIPCRELTLQNEYLRQENRILKSKMKTRISFTNDERRTLVDAALAMGRNLMEQVVTIVKPKTILAWQRRLEEQKWDYSDRRKNNPGRPRIALNIEELVCQMACEDHGITPRFFLRDNDMLYPEGMATILKLSGADTIKTPFQAPNANSHAERYVLSCKRECLNHLVIFGLNRLQYVVDCYSSFYNERRPHQGIGNKIPAEYNMTGQQRAISSLNPLVRSVVRKASLGGLLKSYSRNAA